MQMTPEARAWLDATVRRILARHALGDNERSILTYELMSHLHAAGEARAAAAGRGEVALEDLEAAFAKAGGDAGLAGAFVEPMAKPLPRIAVGPRLGAFVIDALLLGIGLVFVHGLTASLLEPLAGPPPADRVAHVGVSPWLSPWMYHDPALPLSVQAGIALASAALVLGYFVLLESQGGGSLGKRALGLRVQRVDGKPVTACHALLRNGAKLFPLLLALDVAVLVLAPSEDRQRASDRLAGTIVVRG